MCKFQSELFVITCGSTLGLDWKLVQFYLVRWILAEIRSLQEIAFQGPGYYCTTVIWMSILHWLWTSGSVWFSYCVKVTHWAHGNNSKSCGFLPFLLLVQWMQYLPLLDTTSLTFLCETKIVPFVLVSPLKFLVQM